MARIGFIGLGHMGNPMVRNLLRAGHAVKVYDVLPQAAQILQQYGAEPCASVQALAQESEVIFTMLQNGEQVQAICTGDGGLFAHAQKNLLYIDSSSIDISTTRALHKAARQYGIDMLDAPVSGGVAGAEAGTLAIMVGGGDQDFQRAVPVLQVLGKKIVHAGGAGNGQAAKICNNLILGISMIAVSEGFILGKKLGLDPKKFFEISANASGQCWAMTQYCPMPGVLANVPSSHDYAPGFMAKMMLKDLNLAEHAAEMANALIPLGSVATELYTLFVKQGHGDQDFSAIINLIAGGGEE